MVCSIKKVAPNHTKHRDLSWICKNRGLFSELSKVDDGTEHYKYTAYQFGIKNLRCWTRTEYTNDDARINAYWFYQ